MPNHTPGPWCYEGPFLRTEHDENCGACIAMVKGGSDADLALIAAAPCLLAALEAIAGWPSDKGPLSGKRPMEIGEYAAAVATKVRGAAGAPRCAYCEHDNGACADVGACAKEIAQ